MNKMNKKIVSILVALFMALSALSAVSGDGSDPLDPSDGGADWDGDGLTNAEEQTHGTNMNNADSDGAVYLMDGRSTTASHQPMAETLMVTQMVMV